MFRRFLSASALAAILVLTNSAASYSQTNFDSVVSFGDSLSDNGNLDVVTGGAAPGAAYFQGRFSNGLVWTELLNGPMTEAGAIAAGGAGAVVGTGNLNFAFGGARSDSADPLGLGALLPPGVPTQINAMAPPFLPGGMFAPNTLVTLFAGANDVFDLLNPANPSFPPSSADIVAAGLTTATNVATSAGQLIGLGAQTILVANLPNIGPTPAFRNTPLRDAAILSTLTINQAMDTGLQALAVANPTTNIVQLDIASLFSVALANPGAFGLTNVTQACLLVPACAGGTLAEQNKFLFFDGVHPTAAGHSIIAQFANLTLGFAEAAGDVAAFGEVGVWARLNQTDAVFDRAMSWLHGTYAQQNGLYAEVIGLDGDIDGSNNSASYDFGLYGVRGGLDKQIGNFLIGGSGSFLAGDLNSGSMESEVIVAQGDLYASAYMAPFFATGEVGASVLAFNDIERNTGLVNIKTDDSTGGYQYGAAAEAGALLQFGSISIIPAGRIEYISGHIAGYDENAPLLAKSYQDRDIDAILASGRLRVAAMLAPAGIPTSAFVEVGYEDFVSYDADNINVSLLNNTALPVALDVDDPDARGIYFKTGVNGKLNDAVSFDINYGYASHNGDGDVHSGKLRVKIRN